MTDTATILSNAAVIAGAIAPTLPKNAQLALTTATLLLNAVQQVQAQGADISDEQLAALYAADDAAKQADAAAQIAVQGQPGSV